MEHTFETDPSESVLQNLINNKEFFNLFERNVNVSLLLERANEFLMKKTRLHVKN